MTARGQGWLRGLALVSAAVVLAACQPDNRDLTDYIQEIKARPGGGIEPIPTIEPHRPFIYPGHRRSPFDSSVIAQPLPPPPAGVPGSALIDLTRPRELLEQFPLDSLRLVGSLEQEGARYALIRTPDRTIHGVRIGNYLGQNHGRIVEIGNREVRLIEVVPDAFGGYVERENSVRLSE